MKNGMVRVDIPLTSVTGQGASAEEVGNPYFLLPPDPPETFGPARPAKRSSVWDVSRGQNRPRQKTASQEEENTFSPRHWPCSSLEWPSHLPVRRDCWANQSSRLDAISYQQALGICGQMCPYCNLSSFPKPKFFFKTLCRGRNIWDKVASADHQVTMEVPGHKLLSINHPDRGNYKADILQRECCISMLHGNWQGNG